MHFSFYIQQIPTYLNSMWFKISSRHEHKPWITYLTKNIKGQDNLLQYCICIEHFNCEEKINNSNDSVSAQ